MAPLAYALSFRNVYGLKKMPTNLWPLLPYLRFGTDICKFPQLLSCGFCFINGLFIYLKVLFTNFMFYI